MNRIDVTELHEMHAQGQRPRVIDVRTPGEFREAHLPFADSIPLHRISPEVIRSSANESPIYFVCRTGRRSEEACKKLSKAGVSNVASVDGGIERWTEAGFDIVRGKRTISVERQVRIVAGSLVALGTILGALVHIGFLAIPAFVGSGLAFAGVTDSCAMGTLLARMPWNRVDEEGEAQCSV
jgi:rhodanese-related sulfurtransferase